MSALLLQFALKATVVFMLTWVTTAAMRRQSAAARHVVWTLGMSAALLLPVVGAATPALTISMPADAVVVAIPESTSSQPVAAQDTTPADSPRLVLPAAGTTDRIPNRSLSTTVILAALWAGGVFVSLIRLAAGFLRVRAIASGARVMDDIEWQVDAERAASVLELRKQIAVRQTARTAVPLVCGIWRPTILLPLSADAWSVERRRVVLLHEAAHVKRHDCATLALARLVVALHWFNPLAYVALKRLRTEQERAADDLVLTAGTEASTYADHLLEIARAFRSADPAGATALAMARPSDIEGRLLAILEPSRSRRPLSRSARTWAAVVVMLALVPLASLHVSATAPPVEIQVPAPRVAAIPPRVSPAPSPRQVPAAPSPAPAPRTQTPAPPAPPAVVAAPAPPAPPAPPAATERLDAATRRRVADALIPMLDDPNQRVREQALTTLASMQDDRAVPALIKALSDGSSDVRTRAANALGSMRDRRAVAPLQQTLRDPVASVRRRAAWALGTIGDPAAIDALTAALKDGDPTVREQAAQSLGWIARGRPSASASASQSFDVSISSAWNDAIREFKTHQEDLDKLQEDLKNLQLLPPAPPAPVRPVP